VWQLIRKILTTKEVWFLIIPFIVSKAKNKMDENEAKQPLNLPRGSIRAILTIVITIVVVASLLFSQINCPGWFFDVWLVAIGYYVGYRTDNSQIKTVD